MARADELEPGERIRHPEMDWVVTVTKVTTLLSKTRVYFKAHGTSGRFECHPHKELEEM